MSGDTQRIAVVGIDGAGKSTLVRRFLELAPLDAQDALVLTCPGYHDTPNAPLGELSRSMDDFSRAADALGSFSLKAGALFLQMTLFGPVEQFLCETFSPRVLLCERHALVDTLAYGALYTQLVQANPDRAALEAPLKEKLGDAAWGSILAWQAREGHRLGEQVDVWEVPLRVAELCKRPWEELIPALASHYQTSLPEAVVLLDLSGEAALARVAQRGEATRELHEKATMLEQLRQCYLRAIQALGADHGVKTYVIDVDQGATIDDTLQNLLEQVGLTP